jgi:hypothetical protein
MEKEYKGWLVSDSLLKRSLAVLGHFVLAEMIVIGVLLLLLIILMVFVGIMGALV